MFWVFTVDCIVGVSDAYLFTMFVIFCTTRRYTKMAWDRREKSS